MGPIQKHIEAYLIGVLSDDGNADFYGHRWESNGVEIQVYNYSKFKTVNHIIQAEGYDPRMEGERNGNFGVELLIQVVELPDGEILEHDLDEIFSDGELIHISDNFGERVTRIINVVTHQG